MRSGVDLVLDVLIIVVWSGRGEGIKVVSVVYKLFDSCKDN